MVPGVDADQMRNEGLQGIAVDARSLHGIGPILGREDVHGELAARLVPFVENEQTVRRVQRESERLARLHATVVLHILPLPLRVAQSRHCPPKRTRTVHFYACSCGCLAKNQLAKLLFRTHQRSAVPEHVPPLSQSVTST